MAISAREIAVGRWPGILTALGVDPTHLTGRHTACPVCGGKDRFRFDDRDGRGTFYCNQCRAGDGFTLLEKLRGWDFRTAAHEVEQIVGIVQAVSPAPTFSDVDKLKALTRVWRESRPMQDGDEAAQYLAGRGLSFDLPIPALRFHPGLTYREGTSVIGKFSAMVALVTGPDGRGVTLHRTYLKDGRKAPVPSPKKLMPGKPIKGAAIRLQPAGEVLGVAEGIETALAASRLFGLPCWAAISANGIEAFEPPEGIRRLQVFADNDPNQVGQRAGYVLAARLAARKFRCDVEIPDQPGDWLDVLNARRGDHDD